jgi:hypothetical protein
MMSPELAHQRGDQLVSQLMKREGDYHVLGSLLREIQEGYPVEKLRPILAANDEDLVADGMWIAAELGSAARPLLPDVLRLLRHPFREVRCLALGTLLDCARPEDREAVSLALDLLTDPEELVSSRAMFFLARAPDAVLRAVMTPLSIDEQSAARWRGLGLLLSSTRSPDSEAVALALTSVDPLLRRYAVAAAARRVHSDPGLLRQAVSSADPAVEKFAREMLLIAGVAS